MNIMPNTVTTAERVAHSQRFRTVSNRYPRQVAAAYGGDLARAARDADDIVAAVVAAWECGNGLPVRDWPARGREEGRNGQDGGPR